MTGTSFTEQFVAVQDMHLTADGRAVDRMNPKASDWDLRQQAPALAKLCRYGGSMPDAIRDELGIPQDYECRFFSVLEHEMNVADQVIKLYPDAPIEWEIEALTHDTPEFLISDLIAPVKRALKLIAPEFGNFEHGLDRTLGEALGIQLPLRPEINAIDKRMPANEGPALFPMTTQEIWSRRCGEPFEDLVIPNPRYTVSVQLTDEQLAMMGLSGKPVNMTFTSYPPLVTAAYLERLQNLQARRGIAF